MAKKRISSQEPPVRIKKEELPETADQVAEKLKVEQARKALKERAKKPLGLKKGQRLQLTKGSSETKPGSGMKTKTGSTLKKQGLSDAAMKQVTGILNQYARKPKGTVKKGDIRKRLKKISRTPGGRTSAGLMAVAGVMINAIDKAKEEDKKSVKVGGMTFTVSPPKSGDRPSKDKMLEEQKKQVKKARQRVYGR